MLNRTEPRVLNPHCIPASESKDQIRRASWVVRVTENRSLIKYSNLKLIWPRQVRNRREMFTVTLKYAL